MVTTQKQISLAYFARHKNYVFGGMMAGFGLVLLLNWIAASHSSVPSIWLVQLLLCCPFGLRTIQGRAWWLSYVCLFIGSTGFYYLGIHSPLGTLCALIVIVANSLGVCLRWNVP